MDVWVTAFRLVDVRDCDCGEDDDGDALRDCRLPIGASHEVPRVAVALGRFGEFVILLPSVDTSCRCVFGVFQGGVVVVGCGNRGCAGRERVCRYC